MQNEFYYTGRRVDPETGLYYYRARYYSPRLGRFLQTDPVGASDDVNQHLYASNNPTNNIDPAGLWSANGHASLYESALLGRITRDGLDFIKRYSAAWDKRTQGAQYNPVHAMKSKHVSAAEGRRLIDGFIQAQARIAREQLAAGDLLGALEAFTRGAHAITDRLSDEHTTAAGDPKDWPSKLVVQVLVGFFGQHGYQDMFPDLNAEGAEDISARVRAESDKILRSYFDSIFQDPDKPKTLWPVGSRGYAVVRCIGRLDCP